jgi:hypothetical protein
MKDQPIFPGEMGRSDQPAGRAILVIAHPGHELRVLAWVRRARPRVCVLTNGAGRTGRSRLSSTTELLQDAGAQPLPLFGRYSDAVVYQALLDHHFQFFLDLADELMVTLLREQISSVVGDAAEGYNPSHDVCRLIINTAVALVGRYKGRAVANYEFALIGPPGGDPRSAGAGQRLELTEEEFAYKLAAARRYPALKDEVQAAAQMVGVDAFRVEALRPAPAGLDGGRPFERPPAYERHGEERVAAGHYSRVIRYRQHVLPLVERLHRHMEEHRP